MGQGQVEKQGFLAFWLRLKFNLSVHAAVALKGASKWIAFGGKSSIVIMSLLST